MALTKRVWGFGKAVVLLAALGTTFVLFAAAGMRLALRAREVIVPDLQGRRLEDARAMLGGVGLLVRLESDRRIHPTIPAGAVVEQDPAPGLTARRQRSVRLWLSAGARATQIPGLVGETEQGARMRLQEGALDLRSVAEIRSNRYPSGVVVSQDPAESAPGTAVSILLNRGERSATFVMPDLIGAFGADAAELLRQQGFRVSVVADHPYPGVPDGVVLRQFPQAGFQIAPGDPISLEVSR